MSRFVLYFLFLFEQFRHHPELPIGMYSVHALRILLAQISTGIFRMERSAICGTSPPLPHRFPIKRGLCHQLHERDVAGGMKSMTGMSVKNSGLDKLRGAGRRSILAAVVMAASSARKMMKSLSTARLMLTRQLKIHSSKILSKGTVTVIQKTIRTIFPDSTMRLSSARNWRPSCPTPGRS